MIVLIQLVAEAQVNVNTFCNNNQPVPLQITVSNDIDLGAVVAGSTQTYESPFNESIFTISGDQFRWICTDIEPETQKSGIVLDLDFRFSHTGSCLWLCYFNGLHILLTGNIFVKMNVQSVQVSPSTPAGEYTFTQVIQVEYCTF